MIDQANEFEKPVPYWVGFMVAVLLFGGIGIGGVYWVWNRYTTPSRDELVEVPAIPQARISLGTPAPKPVGVQRTQGAGGQITYTIQATDATLAVSKSTAQPSWSYTFSYSKTDLMTPDQTAAATARFRLLNDPGFARSLKVTDEQMARLKEVPPVTTMMISDADQGTVKAAFARYESQNTSANEQALIKDLGDVANRSLTPTRTRISQLVGQIKGILTPEQIKPFAPQ